MADSNSREPAHDGRAETRTTFYSDSSAPPTVDRSWEELASLNDDMRHPDRAKQNHRSDQQRSVEVLCSTLDCTDHQVERTKHILGRIDNIQEEFPTMPVESVALGIATLVIDADVRDVTYRSTNREGVQRMMDELDLSLSKLRTIREKARAYTNFGNG